MNDVIAILQARAGSSRFPGKIFAPLLQLPLLAVLMRRVHTPVIKSWWLATSDHPQDMVTAAWGEAMGWKVYRGSEEDVLSRFTGILGQEKAKWVVRLTADNPFADAAAVELLVQMAQQASPDTRIIGGPVPESLPLGYFPAIVRAAALFEAEGAIPAEEGFHRSNVTSWTISQYGAIPAVVPSDWPARPAWRWTVDTPADHAMAGQAFALWSESWSKIAYPEMVAILDRHPEIIRINEGVRQKDIREG